IALGAQSSDAPPPSQRVPCEQTTVWSARFVPAQHDWFASCGGNGTLQLHRWPAPAAVPQSASHASSVAAAPLLQLCWTAGGVCALAGMDKQLRVGVYSQWPP